LSKIHPDSVFDFLLGVPFVKGGQDIKGFDCWGLHAFCRRYVNKSIISFKGWVCHLERRKNLIESFEREFVKLDKPEPFCLVVFKAKRQYHFGTVLPGCLRYIHIIRNQTVSKQDLADAPNLIVGFYNYAENSFVDRSS